MKNKKQRQQPFHVRRVRMKQSIIKSNQMLQSLTLSDNNLKNFRAITQPTRRDDQSPDIRRKMTYNSSMVNEIDLLNLRLNKAQFNHIKLAVQLSKNSRYKKAQTQMQQNGLQAIKIQARQSVKKILLSKEPQCCCKVSTESDKKSRNAKLKTLRNVSPQQEFLKKNTSAEKFRLKSTLAPESDQKTNRMFIEDRDNNSLGILDKIDLSPSGKEKTKLYLYEKMALSESKQRDRSNLIYEKRIKSYTDFIWKLLLAHNVFLDIDLSSKWSPPKLKFYISKGNNCNMVKGLIKRRFWWSISEQFTQDCSFVWTQIKVNKIYERQQIVYESPTQQIKQNEKHLQSLLTSSNKKLPPYLVKSLKRGERERFKNQYSSNKKIWNNNDFQLLERYFLSRKQKIGKEQSQQDDKNMNYREATQKIRQKYKNITFIDNVHNFTQDLSQQSHNYYQAKPIIHNHLQNNFLLGNKKALFYNLKEYYGKINEDVFSYIPLTFHIKKGFKDPEYRKFIHYFQQRAKTISKQTQEKERNIWIVKPGQNSNRGNGIIVIDQIYEFDNLIKKTEKKAKKTGSNDGEAPQTYIIQKYIDRPFLYNQRKFDIRHYILMTNLYGVTRAYWYQQGYIRTSAYPFDIGNFQSHIHLTNDAVQVNYADYGKYQSHNKISYNQFQNYLNLFPEKKYNFKEQILPQMKKMATDAAKSVYLKITSKQQMHNFQIFGLDFMIDKKFKPWLIEINTNPCLECQCPLLNRIIPYMVQQSLKLSIDLVYPPPSHYPSLWKHNAPLVDLESFKYELIFDSLYEGQALRNLYSDVSTAQFNLNDIGLLQTDECFRNDGKQIKLQDYT